MTLHHAALTNESRDLLKALGQATESVNTDCAFEYRPLHHFPFGWVQHPQLREGMRLVRGTSIGSLRETGCISFEKGRFSDESSVFHLTDRGLRYYAVLLVEIIADSNVNIHMDA